MSAMLSHTEARAFYDHFGAKQDSQAFYEDAATDHLTAHADFGQAKAVFEFGCGTGRFAEKLLDKALPDDATYVGIDISTTMVGLARQRLQRFRERAQVRLSEGAARTSDPSASFDRFVSNYVLDLLSEDDIHRLVGEAHRLLRPDGLLCIASLTHGTNPLTRLVSRVWSVVHSVRPVLVGGCRPVAVAAFLPTDQWEKRHVAVITRFGLSSEVVIAARRPR
jgi:ubiquinone/menaquinone biosynthesis C-methylase UbiE